MKGSKTVTSIFSAALVGSILVTGCIVPNKDLISLKNDVEELKKETARIQLTAGIKPDSSKSRIDEMEREIEFLSRDLKKTRAASDAKLNAMRGEIQALGGRFEEVKHLTGKASDNNRSFLTAVDSRLTAIEGRIERSEKKLDELKLDLELIKKASVIADETSKEPEITSADLYKSGLDAIKKGKTREARDFFNRYLKLFPDGPLANNAQFWIGESFYDDGDFERSIIEYDDVIKKYPGGGKVPAALLKQGMAFEKIKDKKTAEALYKKLIKQFPDLDEAKKAKNLLSKKNKRK
ncbi:MAG: tol-pal system protein YbgF [Deltaproteobacteria bacterium]|nr:tol-pal system protein YbgF [Deltaproteobacteria bacterium]